MGDERRQDHPFHDGLRGDLDVDDTSCVFVRASDVGDAAAAEQQDSGHVVLIDAWRGSALNVFPDLRTQISRTQNPTAHPSSQWT